MKFALNVVALVVSISLCTPPVQPLHNNVSKLLLSVTANDDLWAKYLNVGIKLKPKNLSAVSRNVLMGLKVLKNWPEAADKQQHEQVAEGHEKSHDVAVEAPSTEDPEKSHDEVVVARALYIVTDVSSHYDKQGVAVEFAMDAMVSAIKCNTLKYVLMQLHAIEKTNELQNEAITSQPSEVWNTMVQVLDKISVLKESIEMEVNMYHQWEVISNQDMTKKLPSEFKSFKSLVESTLNESCELNTFDEILKNMEFNSETENLNTATGAKQIFDKCQKLLTKMFNDLPISSMKPEVWESFLNKPKLIKSSEDSDHVN
uniref:Uncharacterized protein n=1 Tax=Schizaphis graminum TaxID=13262 RepID=A0A2S2P4K7_SCHGA